MKAPPLTAAELREIEASLRQAIARRGQIGVNTTAETRAPNGRIGLTPSDASEKFGGAGGDRTPDPQTASLMLSQLSYSPTARNLLVGSAAVKDAAACVLFAARGRPRGVVSSRRFWPEWRNWYTQGPQKAPALDGRVGSNPTSGTISGSPVSRVDIHSPESKGASGSCESPEGCVQPPW